MALVRVKIGVFKGPPPNFLGGLEAKAHLRVIMCCQPTKKKPFISHFFGPLKKKILAITLIISNFSIKS